APGAVPNGDASAHHGHKMTANGEAEAEAACILGEHFLADREWLVEIVLDSLGNPGAAVGDIDDELLLVMPPGDIDSFSTRRIVQSIDNDVAENLGQSAAIDLGDKLRVAVRNCDADTKPSSFPHIQLMLILDHFLDFGRLID